MKPAVTYYRKSIGNDIESQRHACKRYAEVVERAIAREYVDEDISGSKRLHRAQFQELLEDIRSGKLAGHIVIVRDQDRLTRDDRLEYDEWMVATMTAEVQTFDASGRQIKDDFMSGLKALLAKEEVRQLSKRVKDDWNAKNAAGIPPSTPVRPFGYGYRYANDVPDDDKHKHVDIKVERKILHQVRDKLFAGQKLFSICKWLKDQGAKTTKGNDFLPTTLSQLLRRWEYAGWRTGSEGERLVRGQWDAVWSDDNDKAVADQERILTILGDNRPFAQDNARKHLLSGILVCGNCASKLRIAPVRHGYAVYRCQAPKYLCDEKVSIGQEHVDNYMTRRVYEEIKQMPRESSEIIDNSDKVKALNIERDSTVQARKDGALSLRDMAELVSDIDAKIKSLQDEESRQPLPVDSAQQFIDASVDVQRATIKRMYPVVAIHRAAHKGPGFAPERLEFPES